jgi:SAM-dependent methyltransferase
LARHVREIVGVDLSRGMMGKLRGKQTNEVIHLIEGDATRLPLPDSSFDAVVAVHVFHLIPTWREAVQEVARVLRPDGVLVNAYGGVGTSQMWAIWDAVRNEGSKRNVGIQNIQQETFLAEIGWQSAGGKQTHTYKVAQTPRSFIERIANRTFSNTWRMSDEELSDILDKVRAAALEQFGDLDASIERDTEFIAEAYTPPSA